MTTTYIIRSEFEYTLRIWKKNKSPESDNINAELLQYVGKKTKKELFKLTRDLYNPWIVPKDFNKNTFVLLPKKQVLINAVTLEP